MRESIKYLRYLLLSSIFVILFSCDSGIEKEKELPLTKEDSATTNVLTREDSIFLLAEELNIEFNRDSLNIHDVLNLIINEKENLIARLDSLDERADDMESMAYEYKKKEDARTRKTLLAEIDRIKAELIRIKTLIKTEEVKKDSLAIPEKEVSSTTTSFEDLKPGNYITRIDRYHVISVYISPNHDVIFSEPRLDSTTVIRGKRMSPRITKELEQLRNKINKNQ